MEPIVLIHGYSAESDKVTPDAVKNIYGSFPDDLKNIYKPKNVIEIDVSRYISLNDGLTIDDISRALDRALKRDYPKLLKSGFNVIIHSTGALVIRNWVRTFSDRPSPVKRIIYLAGANFGSGWAHIGKGQLVKWYRYVADHGADRGLQVLSALELGSSWTIDLHRYFMQPGSYMRKDYGIFEFVVVGTQADVKWYEIPVTYAKEDGSDGVVRVSASNVNINYLHFRATEEAKKLSWAEASKQETKNLARSNKQGAWYAIKEALRPGENGLPKVPFAIPYTCAHSGENMGIVTGKQPREQVLKLVDIALSTTTDKQWADACTSYDAETEKTYNNALQFQAPSWWKKWIDEPRAQYDKCAQVIFRVHDQDGRPVEHFDIFFDSEKTEIKSVVPIQKLFEDDHRNDVTKNVITFYLRLDAFNADAKIWEPRLPKVQGLFIEVSATEPLTDNIAYLPLRYELNPKDLLEWIKPHTTTIVDVELLRLPADIVFTIFPT
jgi:hypothetical protein